VRRRILELGSTAFYILADTLVWVTFAEGFVAEVRAQLEEACMQPESAIDEEFSILNGMFSLSSRKNSFVKAVFLGV